MGTNKAAEEKTEDWKKTGFWDERKMKWNRKHEMDIKMEVMGLEPMTFRV